MNYMIGLAQGIISSAVAPGLTRNFSLARDRATAHQSTRSCLDASWFDLYNPSDRLHRTPASVCAAFGKRVVKICTSR
jgi:hypothetical protein